MELMMKKLKRKLRYESPRKTNEEEWFLEKGGIFLEKLIADCNGKSIPIRNFSSSQILKATNDFDYSCLLNFSWDQEWYKAIIEDKSYLIKRFVRVTDGDAFNDIVLSSRMSNHNNFLKLLGCCFEFSSPVVLFEYAEHAIVNNKGRIMVNRKETILPWSVRLKIAKEFAIAITYLHTAFPRIIIHKAIKPSNIFIDKNWKAKLIDFRFSVSLPLGKSKEQDKRITGTHGYMDPLYHATRSLSEYTDVYSFGVCLLVFLIGSSPLDFQTECDPDVHARSIIDYSKGLYENGKVVEVIDRMIAKDITNVQRLQVEAFVVLALKCCNERNEDRPKMIQVAKELKRIERDTTKA